MIKNNFNWNNLNSVKRSYLIYGSILVGFIIWMVVDDKIIGEGYTSKAGGNHAEVNAINSVEDKSLLKLSTIYVTLEHVVITEKHHHV